MLFKSKAKEEFDIKDVSSPEMEAFVLKCANMYRGRPYWVDAEEHIKTINFAKSVCSETARLATLAIGITADGSSRAKWIQGQLDKIYFSLRHWVEYGCAYGTVILKPSIDSIDIVTPDRFTVTDQSNGDITGCVFLNREVDRSGKKYYSRLEYHRFLESGQYAISNRCYVSDTPEWDGKPIEIDSTPWVGMLEDVTIENVKKPLFGVFRTPQANNIDIDSPMGMPIFSEAIEELKDLDIAYSRNAGEVMDSERITLVDDRLITFSGKPVNGKEDVKLPRYARTVFGNQPEDFYQEINPELNTEVRLLGINNLLSFIGFKCGYSNGYFVFDEKTGMVTATQVEADDRRTIQLIKDVRDKLEDCLDDLIAALNVFADLYNLAPVGACEITYDFGDITYNREEDRARWWQYVMQGKVPAWKYFVKFEGMSEEEAKAMIEEAEPKDEPKLFAEE